MVYILPANVRKLWSEWDIRVMVVSSLCLQIVLIVFGSRRKYIAKIWIRVVTWMAYLSADFVATVALGMISNFCGADPENPSHPNRLVIMAFWAPFLLVHLGGPDTITAYSLEDNELWLRHLLSLIVQVAVAVYIFLRSWTTNAYQLSMLAIPMFVAGIIKYAERTWVLWSASTEGFRNIVSKGSSHRKQDRRNPALDRKLPGAKYLHESYKLFEMLKRFNADLFLIYDSESPNLNILDDSFEDVVKQVEVELGFLYDVLYTKAKIIYSRIGIIFRSVSFVCYISVLAVFCLIIDKQFYSPIDVALTYLLCAGAIFLELYAFTVLAFTDWTLYWLSKQKHSLARAAYQAISSILSYGSYGKRWDESMGQFNIIDFWQKEEPHCAGLQRFLGIDQKLKKYKHPTFVDIPIKLKQLIFEQLKDMVWKDHYLLTSRGNHALQKDNCSEKLGWSTGESPFENSILAWHIATDVCFSDDFDKYQLQEASPDSKVKLSKLLSGYMAYILIMRSSMLPKGIGHIQFEGSKYFGRNVNKRKLDTRQVLLQNANINYKPEAMRMDDHGDVTLSRGGWIAKQLQLLEAEEGWENEDKWEMICQVWIEMLCYAASQCGWKEHAQQLRRGGELLTHVCVLMANFGFSFHFSERL